MFIFRGTGYQYIIQINIDKRKTASDGVHQSLECLRCIPKSKWHSNEFEEAKWSGHGSLVDIARLDWDLMICPDKINF